MATMLSTTHLHISGHGSGFLVPMQENLKVNRIIFQPQSTQRLDLNLCPQKEKHTNIVLPLSLTMLSGSEGSASGGGVNVSMERTGASCEGVFSVQGICRSEGVVAQISSGGGVCISGSKFKDGWTCMLLSHSEGSDMEVMG